MKRLFTHPFIKFVFKKAVFYLIVAFIALTFIFLIPSLMPGNPIDQMIPPGTTDEGRLRLKAELAKYLGFDKSKFAYVVIAHGLAIEALGAYLPATEQHLVVDLFCAPCMRSVEGH